MSDNGNKYIHEITDYQVYLFNTGTNYQAYKMFGTHRIKCGSKTCWSFSVWAPEAENVSVVGEFNGWNGDGYNLTRIHSTGIWSGAFEDVKELQLYKYRITASDGNVYDRADPYAVRCEIRPGTASCVAECSDYKWTDSVFLKKRKAKVPYREPMNIYEVHAGSWKTHPDGSFYSYRELADTLIPYVKEMSYTHIELMPVMEYPFDGSWGYQVTGYFAPTSRYGSPEDLKYFVNKCHDNGIYVIMDWVPAHFPRDAHGLRIFDGKPLYEYPDARMGEHKDWGTMVFDYGRDGVVSFLMSSAYYWAAEFHFDGLRVDAVSSMLYRNYSRNDGEWIANKYGGTENLEAIEFFKKLNSYMKSEFPGFLMIAEESTAWPKVTHPTEEDGLGFTFKWNMGWMNDSLRYISMDPYFRKDNHSLLTFLMMYAYSEKYILPLSHDEVVHGKKSMLDKFFGNMEDKYPAYRAFLAYYMTIPGKKLMFMGGEFGQMLEWRYDEELEWNILDVEQNKRLKRYVKELNKFYTDNRALWECDDSWDGFRWINYSDNENSVISYMRMGKKSADNITVVSNFTPVDRPVYKIGVPEAGTYEVVFSSDSKRFGGSLARRQKYKAKKAQYSDMSHTITIGITGNTTVFIKKVNNCKSRTERKDIK
ncbi:MAG: 1,4-alpha-glucan branching protein GlgB [Clostridia bacterium]|nr:1,4-alpha-glucan branching protein GlgB [Clostridia bacterium]